MLKHNVDSPVAKHDTPVTLGIRILGPKGALSRDCKESRDGETEKREADLVCLALSVVQVQRRHVGSHDLVFNDPAEEERLRQS